MSLMARLRDAAWRFLILFGMPCALFSLIVAYGFVMKRRDIKMEWSDKMPTLVRPPEDRRAVNDGIIHFRKISGPSFIPQSMFDNSVCSAAVIQAINFILGEDRLTMTDAWTFGRDNPGKVRIVYARDTDFRFTPDGQHIEEVKDRGFWLSKILKMTGEGDNATSDRLYVIGYRYHETLADPLVLREGIQMNTHLMLVLGRTVSEPGSKLPYTWWGYHFFHDPAAPDANPFQIVSLGEKLPETFDLVYIWEVLNSEMPRDADPVLLLNRQHPYRYVKPWLGWFGGGKTGYAFDTAMMYYLWNDPQFPELIRPRDGIVQIEAPDSHRGWRGQMLGLYHEVPIRRQMGDGVRSDFGLEFQCVEFVNRYYRLALNHRNMTKTGNADSYFYNPSPKGLLSFANGSASLPKPDDILVFDQTSAPLSPRSDSGITRLLNLK